MVGSEHDEPASGWRYDLVLGSLYSNPNMDGRTLAQTVVTCYSRAYSDSGNAATQSAMDLSQMDDLAQAIDQFASALLHPQTGRSKSIQDARDATQMFSFDDYRDLADFAQQIDTRLTDPAAQQAALQVIAVQKRAVFASVAHGTDVTRAKGVSIFLPDSSQYSAYASNYERLDFAASAPNWVQFLNSY